MYTIRKWFKCDTAHRVFNHESKCAHMHGHEYRYEVFATSRVLDDIGRVLDFSVLAKLIKEWIDENWDHGTILNKDDPTRLMWSEELLRFVAKDQTFIGHKLFLMDGNPTAENLAKFLYHKANYLLRDTDVKVIRVICHETSTCAAIYEEV